MHSIPVKEIHKDKSKTNAIYDRGTHSSTKNKNRRYKTFVKKSVKHFDVN